MERQMGAGRGQSSRVQRSIMGLKSPVRSAELARWPKAREQLTNSLFLTHPLNTYHRKKRVYGIYQLSYYAAIAAVIGVIGHCYSDENNHVC